MPAAFATFLEHHVELAHGVAVGAGVVARQNPELLSLVPRQLDDSEALNLLGRRLEAYATIALAILMLAGDQSPPHLRRRIDALASVLPHATLRQLLGQGHGANESDPVGLAAVISEFAESADPRS